MLEQIARIVEIQAAIVAVKMLYMEKKMRLVFSNRSLLVVLVLCISFILLTYESFEIPLQLVLLIRMIQMSILAYYCLFRKELDVFLSLWIYTNVGSDFLFGFLYAELIPSFWMPLGFFLFHLAFLFFILGMRRTLEKRNTAR